MKSYYEGLTRLLMIYNYPLTWIECELEPMTTRFLKKWAGLTRPANLNLLYLSQKDGGLNLPSLSTPYKKLQLSTQRQLFTSADPTVRQIAELGLQSELGQMRKKFQPAMTVQQTMHEDPGRTRKGLLTAATEE